MITKGIVEEIIDTYSIKVRMPTLDAVEGSQSSTLNKDLSTAIICSLPNSDNLVSKGDIVLIGFEDNDLGKPIILGHLFRQSKSSTYMDLDLRQLRTTSTTVLYKDTTIGEINYNDIYSLKDVKGNIQQQINSIYNDLDSLSGIGITIGETVTGDPGTNAEVINTGTSQAPIFNFTIPRGEQGPQGEQGIPGEQGPQGEQGPPGETITAQIGSNYVFLSNGLEFAMGIITTNGSASYNVTLPLAFTDDNYIVIYQGYNYAASKITISGHTVTQTNTGFTACLTYNTSSANYSTGASYTWIAIRLPS